MREEMALLDQYVAPGLRLWMLIGLVSSVLLTMIVIVCCFVRLRIPRTKRQIELRAAKRKKRKAEKAGADFADQHEQDHYRGGQTIVLNSFNKPTTTSIGGRGYNRKNSEGHHSSAVAACSIPV
ncbi:hypothetical protein Mgra_00000814 [Meloidogyne graminicola]|uniref:Uncharacterized protein n=1 Tax=Meloidogyne graminicola TaxID=189291 RepID=A0A8T0A4P0_9BILA|nr:hypothetical protein Mgra_00000814 [Meloidogyne graminicola]